MAKIGSFFSDEQFELLIDGFDGWALEAGHRWWLSKGLEFSKLSPAFAGAAGEALARRRSGVGFREGLGETALARLVW